MDECAAAVVREDDADENYPHNDDGACENNRHTSADNPSEGCNTASCTVTAGDGHQVSVTLNGKAGVGVSCCRDCGAVVRDEAAYWEHRLLHHQPYTGLNNQSTAEKDNGTSYFCTICSLSFVEMNELHSHLRNHHQASLKETGVVNNPGQTKQDTFVCLKKKPFQCETCGRNYLRASALDGHRRCHEGKLKSKNSSSGDVSQTGESAVETELNENQTKNDSQKHFKCLCGKRFATVSGLKSHQRFSSNSQCGSDEVKQIPRKKLCEFYCTECNKGFRRRAGLIKHQLWHTNRFAERFTCEECGKTFATASNCNRHQIMAHTEETPAKSFLYQASQVQKKAFECKNCGLKFSRVSAFQSHQNNHVVKETVQRARPLEPKLGPLLPEPKLGPQTLETELGAQTLETQPRASIQEIQPSHQYDSQMVAAESGLQTDQQFSSNSQCGSDEVRERPRKKRSEFYCTECNKTFPYRRGLIIHQLWHTNRFAERFTCEECGKMFATASDCYRHQLMAHTEETPAKSVLYQAGQVQKKAFECKDCGLKFSRVSAFQSHQHNRVVKETVQRARPLEPDVGPRLLEPELGPQTLETEPGAKTLEPQPRASTQEIQPSHQYDSQMVAAESGLQTDQQFISNSQCGSDEVRRRPRKKRSEFHCTECNKAFRYRAGLIRHQLWHTNRFAERFTCKECRKTFATASNRYRHQLMAHTEETPAKSFLYQAGQVQKKAFECKDCGLKFSRVSAFQSHQHNRVVKETVQRTPLLEPDVGPRLLEPKLGPQTIETEPGAQTLGPQPKASTQEIQPSHQYDSQMVAAESGLQTDQQFSSNSQCGSDEVRRRPRKKRSEFHCTECNKAFRYRAGLIRHQLWHTNRFAERFTCKQCGKTFATASNCYRHQIMAHTEETPAKSFLYQAGQVQKKAFECKDCGLKFSRVSAFQSHQNNHVVKETVQRARPLEPDVGPRLLEPELKPRPLEPELKPRPLEPELKPRPLEPELKPRPLEPELGPRPLEPELGPRPLEPDVGPRPLEPGLGPRPLETEQEAQTLEPQPRATTQEIQPSDQYDSQTFAAESGLQTHQRFSSSSHHGSDEVKNIPRKKSCEFYCTECNKGFRRRAGLITHQRWHTNRFAERFTCEECGKAFTTASFCYRHQLMAHTEETPAKSFLHQVGQVQKKAFECKDCGLKFSRVTAFQSHQLQHKHVFKETVQRAQPIELDVGPQPLEMEQGTQSHEVKLVAHTHKALPLQDSISESCWKESEHSTASVEEKVQSEISPAACTMDKSQTNETDEDLESYEPGDFNVQVISDSEPEEEVAPDLNPDLVLLCESDQDVRDDTDYEVSPKGLVSKSDLKIIQIDFDQTNKPCAPMESGSEDQTAHERFHCPDCYRWFTSPTSLRNHRMWHGVRKRRQQNQGQSVACEISNYEAQFIHTQFHSDQTLSSGLLNQAEGLVKKMFTCNECGDVFSCLSALVSHQLHHPKRKQYQCPDCMVSYLHAASLFNHMKTCSAQKRKDVSVSKKEYNPKKTLLGPKIYHCEQCGKGFWSLGAFSHHKQNQMECTDLRLRKGLSSPLHSANGHSRSVTKVTCPICGRKFRHKGTMALHMRKHENGNHKCEICSRSFRLFSSLLRHEVVHSDQLLPPPIKSFQHQVEQLKKNTYSCPDCGKLFSREKALQFHMKSHGYESRNSPSSPQSMVKVKNLQCPTCFAHFNNKASLRTHRKLCRKGDIVEAELAKNEAVKMRSDSNKQEQSCQMKEQVDTKNEGDIGAKQIEMHRDGGNVENPGSTHLKYKCNACDKSFPLAGALNFHKRIHIKGNNSKLKSDIGQPLMSKMPNEDKQGKGLIHCSDCGRRFMTKSALGSHRRWHKEKKCSQSSRAEDDFGSVSHKTEDRPFQCKKCEKPFFSHEVLHRHQVLNPLCQTKTKPDLNGNMEQFSILEVEEQQEESSKPTREHDANIVGDETLPSTVKPKPHKCPLCFVTFAKARGLHAHKWQAHPKNRKCIKKLSAKTKCSNSNSQVDQVEDSEVLKSSTVDRGRKKIISNPQPEICISCLECGEQCSSTACLLDHKKGCSPVKQESKMEVEPFEAAAEVPPAGHLLEHTVKCLFKCDKCGKAFRTEEQLGTHKNKAKSKPHCCALCCHGFWTENQLQQHLAWHDQVRCRLPNEVRFRLSAAVTSSPSKPNFPVAEKSFPLHTISQPPLYPAGCSDTDSQRPC